MKPFIKTRLIVMLVLIVSSGVAHNTMKNEVGKTCLEVVGVAISESNEPIDGVEVKLLKENDEMEWVEVTNVAYHDHDFTFALEADSYYTIEVSKKGYVTRSVGISTKLPAGTDYTETFKYGFEVILFQKKEGMNDFYLDFPVALVSYNPKTEVFENNESYTRNIKTKIKESEPKAMSAEVSAIKEK
jgi:hypothetical protein